MLSPPGARPSGDEREGPPELLKLPLPRAAAALAAASEPGAAPLLRERESRRRRMTVPLGWSSSIVLSVLCMLTVCVASAAAASG